MYVYYASYILWNWDTVINYGTPILRYAPLILDVYNQVAYSDAKQIIRLAFRQGLLHRPMTMWLHIRLGIHVIHVPPFPIFF
jgi:hypothetical protein